MLRKACGTICAITVATLSSLVSSSTSASAVTLYNGLSLPNQTPAQQGWLYQGTSVSTAPSATATTSGTILNTGNRTNYSGYFKSSPNALNRSTGYSIQFGVRISSESHSNNNRAGFSLIVMSASAAGETQPYGIELGFWTNSIWAQNVGFTRGENAAFNTQSTVNTYTLSVQGLNYKLYVNGSSKPILQGALRQYTGFTPPLGYPNPYTTPNLIFMGDDTTSATAIVIITRVDQF
ncbi:MAG TPA: hypothetical protein V6C78_25290 [Crinalium sp.]|jgi:hypothetical protein